MLNIVWFKRDLRITDHAPLIAGVENGIVLPLYIIEPDMWRQPTASARQWRFVSRALAALRTQLAVRGAPLVVRFGEAEVVLDEICSQSREVVLWSHEETGDAWTTRRNKRVADWARSHAIPWHEFPQAGVVRGNTDSDGWAGQWDRRIRTEPLPAPDGMIAHGLTPGKIISERLLYLDDDFCDEIPAGPNPARHLLNSFLSHRGAAYRREMSSPNTAFDACSRLSPHLSWGTISTRETWHAAKAAGGGLETEHQRSLDSFVSRLHWRCHFIQKLEDQPDIEHHCMDHTCEDMRPLEADDAKLKAWGTGHTGYPLIDACMRALDETGWLNFRMRAMCASFVANHLWQDWRAFGVPLARLFTDFEPGIHWSQCQTLSGVTDTDTVRIDNPVKLAQEYDADGVFTRRWVPELSSVPAPLIHQPWKMSDLEQADTDCVIGRDYPSPIVDHLVAGREAGKRIAALRSASDTPDRQRQA